jgi:hypothetical protein
MRLPHRHKHTLPELTRVLSVNTLVVHAFAQPHLSCSAAHRMVGGLVAHSFIISTHTPSLL